MYADDLENFGYYESPLEKTAYLAQKEFGQSKEVFYAEALVVRELKELSLLDSKFGSYLASDARSG